MHGHKLRGSRLGACLLHACPGSPAQMLGRSPIQSAHFCPLGHPTIQMSTIRLVTWSKGSLQSGSLLAMDTRTVCLRNTFTYLSKAMMSMETIPTGIICDTCAINTTGRQSVKYQPTPTTTTTTKVPDFWTSYCQKGSYS